MQNSLQKITLMCALFLFVSCLKQSESITPFVRTQSLAEIQREAMLTTALNAGNSEISEDSKISIQQSQENPGVFYLNLKYNITEMDVYDTADIPNSFEKLSNSFLRALAKLFLKIKGSMDIEMDPVELNLPDLNLDFDVVKSIRVKRVYLEYNKEFDRSVNNKASFAFINGLDLNRVGRNKSLLIGYKKASNNCKYKCLDFSIPDGNILDLIKNNSQSIILKPKISIGSIPKVSELILDGQIELQIGLKLPF